MKKEIKKAVKDHQDAITVMLKRNGPEEWNTARRLMASELGTHLNILRKTINKILES